MALLAGYHSGAVDEFLFDEPFFSAAQFALLVQAALSLAIALTRWRRAQAILVLVYLAATATGLAIASRLSYG